MTETRVTPAPSDADPCVTCPWRTANQGKRHPDGWYTKTNRARLWSGLRNGQGMSCHPTDPDNIVSEKAQAAGYRPAPPGTTTLECRGGAVLQQREVHLLQEEYGGDFRAYHKARPSGLTKYGLAMMVRRLLFPGVPFFGGPPTSRPNLNTAVGYEPLPWTNDDDAPETAGQP